MPFGLGKPEKRSEGNVAEEEAAAVDPDEHVGGSDPPAAEAPAPREGEQEAGAYRPPTFRPSFMENDDAGAQGAPDALPRPAPEGDTFFVTTTREGKREIHGFDSPAEAQAFVERCLEEGLAEEEVSAFSGHRLAVAISHRPVVKLVGSEEE